LKFNMNDQIEINKKDSDIMDSIKSREIVQEILRFGVNDDQIKKIIKLLALEIVDRELMLKIVKTLEGEEDNKIEL
tara:strand:- start:275 stop:502 length:228 start_codon:yes stop_codon:yes gene_type:complete